jgi:MerR family transcriptional regulator, light-induced transcriptional regulator
MSAVAGRTNDPTHPKVMTIGEVSEFVRVPIPTLRSWESRYRIPPRPRSDGSTRRYSAVDVQMLSLMRDDVSRGIRAAEAARSVRSLFDDAGGGAPFVSGLLDACDRLDAVAVGAWLDRAVVELGLGPCLDEVLFPAMRRIGLGWQMKQRDVSQAHLTTDAVCRWLHARATQIPLAPGSPLVLLAPADQHNVGMHALAVLLHHRGLRCGGLPNGMSVPALAAAVRSNQPAAVVLLSHLLADRARALARLHVLVSSGAEIFYAGNAFASARSRRGVPGRYLGVSLQQAAELIDASVRPGTEPGRAERPRGPSGQ